MSKEDFLERMTDILDVEEDISLTTNLVELEEWDSLSIISYVALVNTSFGKKVDIKEVRMAVSIGDLYNLAR